MVCLRFKSVWHIILIQNHELRSFKAISYRLDLFFTTSIFWNSAIWQFPHFSYFSFLKYLRYERGFHVQGYFNASLSSLRPCRNFSTFTASEHTLKCLINRDFANWREQQGLFLSRIFKFFPNGFQWAFYLLEIGVIVIAMNQITKLGRNKVVQKHPRPLLIQQNRWSFTVVWKLYWEILSLKTLNFCHASCDRNIGLFLIRGYRQRSEVTS